MAMLMAVDVVVTMQSPNPRNSVDDIVKNCWRKVDSEFRAVRKSKKILVNGKEVGFYGFDNSAEHLIELDMSKTGISIPFHNTSFQNLMILKATFNNYRKIVDGIGNETFPALRILNFSYNSLDSFDPKVLEHMKEIEILDFSHNCIEYIHNSPILRLRNIREIHLQHNLIKSFKMWPSDLDFGMHLHVLDISHNEMTEFLDSKIIIENLDVAHNNLSSLQVHHASKMNLYASFNELQMFGDRNVGTFHFLDLSHNNFKTLSEVKLKVATTLDLSHNGISMSKNSEDEDSENDDEMKDDSFDSDRINVVNMNLSFNSIRKISEISEHFNVKKILFLDNNRLSAIDFEIFKISFPSIERVNLNGNPLTSADENELKFHNNTQLLSIRFGYDFMSTKAAPSPSSTPIPSTTVSTSTILSRVESDTRNKTTSEKTPTMENSTSLNCTSALKSISLMGTESPIAKTTSKSTTGSIVAKTENENQTSGTLLVLSVASLMLIGTLLIVNFIKTMIRNPHIRLIETRNEFENVRIDYC